VLRIISSSPGELKPVFNAMLENAVRLCEAEAGNLYLYDGEAFHAAALHSASQAYTETRRRRPLVLRELHPDTPLARTAQTRAVVHTADVRTEKGYIERDPRFSELVDLSGARTHLAVPMLKENELIGAIDTYRLEVRPFTDKQIALVQNFAAQAVIAIENTRLLNELKQSLEQQTATSEVLRVISSSQGELQPVFQAMLENATRICEAKFGTLYLREGDGLRAVALHGAPLAYAEERQRHPVIFPGRTTLLGRTVATKQTGQIADIQDEADYALASGSTGAQLAKLGGARTVVAVPMVREDESVGAVVIYRQEVRSFSDKQVELLTNFAAQAVIAIENARLLNELRTRTDELGRSVSELQALGEVSQAVNSTLDLETVLSTIVAKAVQLSATEAGAIYGYDDQARELRLRATYGMDQSLIDALTQRHIGLDDPSVAEVFAQREPTQVADLREEPASDINEITLRRHHQDLRGAIGTRHSERAAVPRDRGQEPAA
jgi:GAF domain-containing protein